MKLWEEFLISLEKEFKKDTIDKWLRTLRISSFDACNLHLETKDAFQALWFEEHIRKKVEQRLFNNNGRKVKVHLVSPKPKSPQGDDPIKSIEKPLFETATLHTFHTLKHWILTKDNIFSLQALAELVQYDLTTQTSSLKKLTNIACNPLLVCGEKGTGKTHLLEAIAYEFKAAHISVCYLDAQTFTDYLVKAIKSSKVQEFRKFCRESSALIIDNIDIFSNKRATQEEFFHTFNHYHTQGKPILLSSAHLPKDLKEIEARLISRFEWGLTLPLKPLCKTKQPKLLDLLLTSNKLTLSHEVQDHLLSQYQTPRALSQAVEMLHLKRCIEPSCVRFYEKLSYIENLLAPLTKKLKKEEITVDHVLRAVCKYFDRSKEELIGKSQRKENVHPRKIAMYLLKKHLYLSYVKIGRVFSKDHSTIITSVEFVRKKLEEKDSAFLSEVHKLKSELFP